MAQYKTIVLELIRENPELYERLRSSKRLLPAMDAYAIELKASHEAWKDQLGQARPGSDPSQSRPKRWSWRSRTCGPFASASPRDEAEPAVPRRGDELHPPAFAARVRAARGQPPCRCSARRRSRRGRRTAGPTGDGPAFPR